MIRGIHGLFYSSDPEATRQFFKDKVFDTVIPRNVRLGEAPSHGMPVILYDVKSRGATAYLALAREVLARMTATAA